MLQLGEPFLAQLTQSLCSHCLAVFSDIFVNSPESRTTVHWQNDECGATQNSGCSDAGKAQKLKAPYKASFKAPDNSTLARKDFQPIPHHTSLPSPLSHLFFHCFLKFSLIPIQQQQQQQQFFNLDHVQALQQHGAAVGGKKMMLWEFRHAKEAVGCRLTQINMIVIVIIIIIIIIMIMIRVIGILGPP